MFLDFFKVIHSWKVEKDILKRCGIQTDMAQVSGDSIIYQIPSRNGNFCQELWDRYLVEYFAFPHFAGMPTIIAKAIRLTQTSQKDDICYIQTNVGRISIKKGSATKIGLFIREPGYVYYINFYLEDIPRLHLVALLQGASSFLSEKGF